MKIYFQYKKKFKDPKIIIFEYYQTVDMRSFIIYLLTVRFIV